jgi:predicted nucleic acid-binding protein
MNGQPFTAQEAWLAYRAFRGLPEVDMLADPPGLETTLAVWTDQPDFPAGRWTDGYLAALALSSRSRLVSFDSDFHRFKSLDFLHLHES